MSVNANAWLTALGNGSAGSGVSALGQYSSALGSIGQGMAIRTLSRADADAERYAAAQVAANERRKTRQVAGAHRTATAASGAALDEFSTAGQADIEHRGAQDEAMAILNGETRAIQGIARGRMDSSAAYQRAGESLLRGAGYTGNWRGAKHRTEFYDGTTGDSAGWQG